MVTTTPGLATRARAGHWLARSLVVAGLAVDVAVHWHLAAQFDPLKSSVSPHLSQGQLFRVEAAMALLSLVLVIALPRLWTAGLAFMVAAGGVAAVLLYAYVDVGAVGPLPDMGDPSWYPEKTISLVAEGVAALAALWWLVALVKARRTEGAKAH